MRLHSFIHCTWDYSGVDNIDTSPSIGEQPDTCNGGTWEQKLSVVCLKNNFSLICRVHGLCVVQSTSL